MSLVERDTMTPEEMGEREEEQIYPLSNKKISKADFKTLKCVGRGSFAKVVMCEKISDGKIYAMKILDKSMILKRNLLVKTRGKKI